MPVTRSQVETFLSLPALAVIGVSRNSNKFGSIVYRDMKAKGYPIHAVNPNTNELDGSPVYADVQHLPAGVAGLILVVPPAQSVLVVQQAAAAGIRQIWLQPGAESPEVVRFCQEHGMIAIVGECIMMHAGPHKFPHSLHRWVNKITGKLPK